MLGVRLPWFEGPARVASSESGSEILPTSETFLPPNKGVSSSGPLGIVKGMRVRSVGGELEEEKQEAKERGEVGGDFTSFSDWDQPDDLSRLASGRSSISLVICVPISLEKLNRHNEWRSVSGRED